MLQQTNKPLGNVFLDTIAKQFGDKVVIRTITLSDDSLAKLNKKLGTNITHQDLADYGVWPWLLGEDCPNCGEPLLGLFGRFTWHEIQHGDGVCSNCGKVEFRYYHYVRGQRLSALAVIGWQP